MERPCGRNRTRTCDPFCVREVLYPAELSARGSIIAPAIRGVNARGIPSAWAPNAQQSRFDCTWLRSGRAVANTIGTRRSPDYALERHAKTSPVMDLPNPRET